MLSFWEESEGDIFTIASDRAVGKTLFEGCWNFYFRGPRAGRDLFQAARQCPHARVGSMKFIRYSKFKGFDVSGIDLARSGKSITVHRESVAGTHECKVQEGECTEREQQRPQHLGWK